MTAVVVLSMIGAGGAGFMIRFFFAMCKETKGRHTCQVIRIPAALPLKDCAGGYAAKEWVARTGTD